LPKPPVSQSTASLRAVAAVSFLYDFAAGISMLLLRPSLEQWVGLPVIQPAIAADLNGIFLITIGIGYLFPLRDPARYRAYLWLAGVVLKTAGAVLFLFDVVVRGGPGVWVLCAFSDALLAAVTLVALRRKAPVVSAAPV
jgi:hypothetical protein